MEKDKLIESGMTIVRAMIQGEQVGYNNGLEYAAKWIEYYSAGDPDPRVVEFATNMAMSIRAAQTH